MKATRLQRLEQSAIDFQTRKVTCVVGFVLPLLPMPFESKELTWGELCQTLEHCRKLKRVSGIPTNLEVQTSLIKLRRLMIKVGSAILEISIS